MAESVIPRRAEHSRMPKNATQKGHSNYIIIIIKKIKQNLYFLLCFVAVTRLTGSRVQRSTSEKKFSVCETQALSLEAVSTPVLYTAFYSWLWLSLTHPSVSISFLSHLPLLPLHLLSFSHLGSDRSSLLIHTGLLLMLP